ncbi:ribosome biogenesis GTPase Der [Aeoliella sp. ICT_H6.2]|uniref:GTPase Der n=1 Tax=Aeoliella straminimaris TaxID=2954799 RepID=A0A9X2JGA2_9BACT|nr:ribosome biogenesis GTPase Der [Aeoliella straminimaris]MCO6044157.1 ribosome biogenesis GTPase Der [Aeoliella straminimaris]
MPVPQIVIVGRPNVGKSSLFNWLAGTKIAIVDDQPGITRDRLTHLMCHEDKFFELVDTGGMGFNDADNLTKHIEDQITVAIESANLILFVLDTRSGLLPMDQEVAKRLRLVKVPVVCLANKADAESLDSMAEEFHRLGFGAPIKVSTQQNRNRGIVLNRIIDNIPEHDGTEEESPDAEPEMKVAIVGRRNVGKSTFVNTLAHAERMIVSEVPGTTRDSVDVRFELDGKAFIAIDTPGLRKGKSQRDIDFYGTHRAQRSIRRADVVLLFHDCTERIGKVDKQLCDYIVGQYKPVILVVNKWDNLAGSMPTEKWVNYLHDTYRTVRYAPIAFITAKTGKNVKALLNHSQMLFKQARQRVGTGELNRMLRDAVKRKAPPLYKNRRPKIYYATQVGTQPPTIVLFCSQPAAIDAMYQRYLLNQFRDHLEFDEVPIKLYLRRRSASDSRDDIGSEALADA